MSDSTRAARFTLPAWLHPSNAGVVYAFAVLIVVLSFATASQGQPSYLSPRP